MRYGANNITDNMVTTDIMMALRTLASTTMSKMEAIDILVAAKKQLEGSLAQVTSKNEKLLNMVNQLTTNVMKANNQKQSMPNR